MSVGEHARFCGVQASQAAVCEFERRAQAWFRGASHNWLEQVQRILIERLDSDMIARSPFPAAELSLVEWSSRISRLWCTKGNLLAAEAAATILKQAAAWSLKPILTQNSSAEILRPAAVTTWLQRDV